jgi:site-specific recombinase XerD
MSTSKLSIRDAIALYADHNEADGKSAKTISWYSQQIGALAAWMEGRGTPTIGDITIPTVELFTVQLRRKTTRYEGHRYAPIQDGPLSSHTVHAAVRALRAFSTWLHRAGYLPENRLADVKPPRTHKAVVDTLTDEEVQKLLAAVDRTTAIGIRDYALIVTYLDTGVRPTRGDEPSDA